MDERQPRLWMRRSDRRCRLAPLVLRIFALQFFFDFRIGLAPEILEIVRNLNRAMTWRENLNAKRNFSAPDREILFHAIEILNASGDRRRTWIRHR